MASLRDNSGGGALATLTAWRLALAELGALGDALVGAIDGGAVVDAIGASLQMREVRAGLARIEPDGAAETAGDGKEASALADVAALVVKARFAERIATRWLARELPADDVLVQTPLGAAILADAMLPAVWDRTTDLVVLVGAGCELVAGVLAGIGQRRLVVVAREEAAGALRVETHAELAIAVRMMIPNPPARVVVRGAPGVPAAEVSAAAAAVETALSDLRIHRNTVAAFSRTWIDHGIANLPAIARAPSVADVGDRLRGLPMVIVAPGPSLAKTAHLLRELKGRAVICAFSHSLKPVIAAGVTPDFVLTVDPQDVRYHFAGCDVSRSTLVNAATVHPAIYALPAERFLTLSANCAIDDWIFEDTRTHVPGGGSVATTALSLALRWGCNPIAYVGLDLSFPGGQYYVGTSHDGGARAVVDATGAMRVEGWSAAFSAMKSGGGPEAQPERTMSLPAWGGEGTVPSSFMFSLFHRWFVDRLGAEDARRTTIYNCTEGGCFIPGMTHRPFADVIAELPAAGRVTLEDAFAGLAPDPARAARLGGRAGTFATALKRTRALAASALAAPDERRLERIEKTLARSLRDVPFVSLLAMREIERAVDIAGRDGQDYLAASRALFATLVRVVDGLAAAGV